MDDPREYKNGQEWWHAAHAPDADMHADICARLDAKDAEIAALRERQLWVDPLIAALVVSHESLDDEATPEEQYDELMDSWTLALTGLRAYYHDHIIAAQRREGGG